MALKHWTTFHWEERKKIISPRNENISQLFASHHPSQTHTPSLHLCCILCCSDFFFVIWFLWNWTFLHKLCWYMLVDLTGIIILFGFHCCNSLIFFVFIRKRVCTSTLFQSSHSSLIFNFCRTGFFFFFSFSFSFTCSWLMKCCETVQASYYIFRINALNCWCLFAFIPFF